MDQPLMRTKSPVAHSPIYDQAASIIIAPDIFPKMYFWVSLPG